jgi:radical SAM protein with 4Fe4S-binding SPASM domain
MGIPFVIFTNGRWQDADDLLTFLSDVPQFQGFLISLHGATAEAHEIFSGVPGSFEETIANIRQARSHGCSVSISTIITQRNYQQVADIVHLGEAMGASRVVFARYLGKDLPAVSPMSSELKMAVKEIDGWRVKGAKVRFGNCIPQCFHPSSSNGCLAGIAFCTIDPWGQMRPCNHAPVITGDLLNEPLEVAWHSSVMQDWRKFVPTQCWTCAEISRCHGGCKAVAQQLGLGSDPLLRAPL